ncbi:hypothetical protein FAVG1_09511 [Fusarium avenaceum]|nr:hypothetical protein FAVG1_09511 [Fusarium avenaceum]
MEAAKPPMMAFFDVDIDSKESLIALFLFGVLTHVFVFRKGEWDLWASAFLRAWVFYEFATPCILIRYGNLSTWQAFSTTNKSLLAFAVGLTGSILIYRAFFHRLSRFPGPFRARLSNLYATKLANKDEHMYLEVQELHRRYGDIVRIGPTELSIATPKAFRTLHASNSPITKGPFYNVAHPNINVLADRDKKSHASRRKTWDRAFTAKAVRDYEPRVVNCTKLLTDQIDKTIGEPLNISMWFNFFTFDIVGDLAFGNSFNMLRDGIKHKFLEEAHVSATLMGMFRRTLWLMPIFKGTPLLNNQWQSFQAWLRDTVENRRKNKPSRPDVFSWILEDYESLENPTKQDLDNLYGDAHLICGAGSDTTSAATSCLIYLLAQHPEVMSKLQAEIDDYKKTHEESDNMSLGKLTYLHACLDESLRLYPVVPSGLQRVTAPEGMQVDDIFIPGDTLFHSPTYTMCRDERCFVRPDEFIPERWTSQPELVKDASVFSPFHMGRGSCAGKQLALMEVRYIFSEILSRYNIKAAPGTNPEAFVNGLRDCFTMEVPELKMVFTPRT